MGRGERTAGGDGPPLRRAAWLRAPESRRVLAALTAAGRPARFVGGCVRDALLDPSGDPADLDLATPETPERVTALCEAAGLEVVPTGIRHGTVTVLAGRRHFEVTTLRRDVATDGRHAEVAFTDDFVLDAARRDFTINAMSCDGEGRLFDPFGGREDLFAGRVRFVGDPRSRVVEDYLRILRFFRFFARFGRPPADAAALQACRELATGIDRLSGERVRAELLKLLEAPGAVAALRLMAGTGVLARVLPAVPATFEPLARLPADGLLRLAALLRAAGTGDVAPLAERLRLSNRDARRLAALVGLPLPDAEAPARAHRRAFHRLGPELHLDLLRLAVAAGRGTPAELAEVERLARAWDDPALPVSGADLLARGVPQGPGLGALLARLHAWWEAEDFAPDRTACLRRLDELLKAAPDP
jgi:poly(A) polymerase